MKIKIRLEKWEKAVVMQVLEQTGVESPCVGASGHITIFEWDGMKLKSASAPELWDRVIFLRGLDPKSDYNVVSLSFSTNTERDNYYNKVVWLFKEFNNRDEKESNNIFILE